MARKDVKLRFSDLGGEDVFLPRSEFRCGKCHKPFKPKTNYQIFCSQDCEEIVQNIQDSIESAKLDLVCDGCGLGFRKRAYAGRKNKFCGSCTHQAVYLDRKTKEKEKGELPPKKPRRGISYVELNRRAEYRRVFDEAGWDHFNRGRKWDRI